MEQKKTVKQKNKRRSSLFSAFLSLPARLAAALSGSLLGKFFYAYEKNRTALRESRAACRLKESRLHRLGKPLRRIVGELFTHSPLALFVSRLADVFRDTETRAYGVLFGTFGIYTIIAYAIRYFAQWARMGDRATLITGIAVVLFSIL